MTSLQREDGGALWWRYGNHGSPTITFILIWMLGFLLPAAVFLGWALGGSGLPLPAALLLVVYSIIALGAVPYLVAYLLGLRARSQGS